MYRRQKFTQVLFSILQVMSNPSLNGVKYNAFIFDVEVISVHNVTEFLLAEFLQLFTENHPLEIIYDVFVCRVLQFLAKTRVGEPPDADAVFWAELLLQEVATCMNDVHHIELICCCHQFLHIIYGHYHITSVCILDDKLHHGGRHARYLIDLFVADGPACEESSVGQMYNM